jgi:hypothetical protein
MDWTVGRNAAAPGGEGNPGQKFLVPDRHKRAAAIQPRDWRKGSGEARDARVATFGLRIHPLPKREWLLHTRPC